jgi:4-hydroxy-3-methylbut-2-enyl diphosphate reductase
LEGVRTLGISAGASAPEILVQELVDAVSERFSATVEEVAVKQEDVIFSIPKALVG